MSAACWFKICNTAEDPTEAEILIYDEIGAYGITANDFVDSLKAAKAKKIHLRINSPGGDVVEGITIYNYLRTFKGVVRVTVDGLAASIASVIAMAGKKITMADNAMMMIHNPWGIVMGGSSDARDLADLLDKWRDQIIKAYARTGQSAEDLQSWMDAETWMDAAECVEKGFADEVDAALAVENFACFNLAKFKHAPTVDMPAEASMDLKAALAEVENQKQLVIKAQGDLKTEQDAHTLLRDKSPKDLKAEQDAHQVTKDKAAKDLKTEQDAHQTTKDKAVKDLKAETDSVQAKVDEELAKHGQKRLNTGGGATKNEYEEYEAEKDPLAKAKLWAKNKDKIIALGKVATKGS